MSETKTLTAVIQFGVVGFVMGADVELEADTIGELVKKIHDETEARRQALMKAQDEDGDLRCFVPAFANGYHSFGDIEVEFGEDFDCCLVELKLDGNEVDYRAKAHVRVRKETSLY